VREYLLVILAVALLTALTTPVARALAVRIGAVAEVRDRDVHTSPTPRLGGLAMYVGLLAGLLLASTLPMMRSAFDSGGQALGLAAAGGVLVVLGVIDDTIGLDAPTKLAGQAVAATVLALLGVGLIWVPVGDGIVLLDPFTSVILTVVIVIVSVNAVNFVDGLDGLAAGVVGIGALAFFGYCYLLSVEYGLQRATLPTLISAITVGMAAGFLRYNLSPARLFMGDTGSMLLGLLLAASALSLTGQIDPTVLPGTSAFAAFLPVLLPLAVIALPLADMVLAVIRRTRRRRLPWTPDREHLHHQLLRRGHSPQRTVLLLYGLTGAIAFTTVATAILPTPAVLGLGAIAVLALLLAFRRPGAGIAGGVRGHG